MKVWKEEHSFEYEEVENNKGRVSEKNTQKVLFVILQDAPVAWARKRAKNLTHNHTAASDDWLRKDHRTAVQTPKNQPESNE